MGPPYDPLTREVFWSMWTVLIFIIVNYTLDLVIITLWEKINFNFSCEHLIANILSYIFGREEKVNWKENNDKIIYGPNKELQEQIQRQSKLIEESKYSNDSDSSAQKESYHSSRVIEMTSSFITFQSNIDDKK